MQSKVKIALIRPQEHDYRYLEWIEDVTLGYLISVLEENDYRCYPFDFAMHPLLTEQDYREAVKQIADVEPDVIIFVMGKHPTNSPFYTGEIMRRCRDNNRLLQTHFLIYGHTVNGTQSLLKEFPADSVVIGEEIDLLGVVQAISDGQSLEGIPGCGVRTNSGESGFSPPLPLNMNLDNLPYPKRYYFDISPQKRNECGYVAALLASRGCYANCTFCHMRAYEKAYGGSYPWRSRTPENIANEIEMLYNQHGVREFAFVDYQFIGPGQRGHKWAQDIAKEILDRKLDDIAFSIYARANDIKYETFSLLKQAGLYAVFIGIESFSQEVLDRYRKGVTVQQNLQAIQILLDLDVRIRMGFITFDHFTSLTEVEESISHLKAICKDKPHLITQPIFFQNILSPLEDTPISAEYSKIGAVQHSVQYDFGQMMTVKQKRMNRNGAITTFADERIAYLSEATRILASELLQRTTMLENQMGQALNTSEHILVNENKISFAETMDWFDNLTVFTVLEFEQIFYAIRRSQSLNSNLLGDLANKIATSCENYDRKYFGFAIKPAQPVRTAVFD